MPKISKKGTELQASAIRKLIPYAEEAKKKGIHIYHLNIGQPDIESPEGALAAVRNNDLKIVEYSHSAGNYSLREKFTEYYKKQNIHITPEEIIVTSSGSEALQFAFMSCLNPGEEILIPEPYYTNYNSFARLSDVVIKTIPSSIESGFALPPIEDFEKAITPKTRAILICNPNNPTGYLYSKEELQKLGEIAKKHDLFLFSDEVYREFCYDGIKHFSVMELPGLDEHVILLDSVSKRYSACGVRIGMFITKNKEIFGAAMKMAQARLSPPSFGQIFSEAAVDTPQSYMDNVLAEYVTRRNVIVEGINKIPGCFCPNPKGAFYTIISLPVDDSDKFCRWLLEDFSYDKKTVMLAPATGFYSEPEKGRKQARITYCLNVDDLKNALICLEEALKVYPGRTN